MIVHLVSYSHLVSIAVVWNRIEIMIKNSAILFRDIRGGKRNNTMLSYSTSKNIITSAKELSKVRSTKQIDITTFIQNKNEKIKNIDEKLEVHQSEINRNNQIIDQLTHNFNTLKDHLDKEKQNTQTEQRKNKLLRDEIERTNKILRIKNTKLEETTKKNSELQKQNQALKAQVAKIEDYTKTINTLRTKVAAAEEGVSDLKATLADKQKQSIRLKEKIGSLQAVRAKQQQKNSEILAKDVLIGNLKQTINELQVEKSKEALERSGLENKIERLSAEVAGLKENNGSLKQKLQQSDKKASQLRAKLENAQNENKETMAKARNRQKQQSTLKSEIGELKSKNTELTADIEEKKKQLAVRDTKIQKLTQKIRQLQNNLGENYKEKDKLKTFQDKIQVLKKRMENLQHLYYGIIPQIQCPFGHELNNPVTIIPCGHNYCLGCKKGYHKECMQCSGKLKIEAVYRNQLMDDIIGIVGGIKQIIEILK